MTKRKLFGKAKDLSEEELLSYLKHDWYRVDIDENGNRMMDIMGYAYESTDEGEGEYRIVEYGRFYVDPTGYRNIDLEGDGITRIVKPCGRERVLAYLSNIASLPRLPFIEVDGETPEGYYCS